MRCFDWETVRWWSGGKSIIGREGGMGSIVWILLGGLLISSCTPPRSFVEIQNQRPNPIDFQYRRTDSNDGWNVSVPAFSTVYFKPPGVVTKNSPGTRFWFTRPGYVLTCRDSRSSWTLSRSDKDFSWVSESFAGYGLWVEGHTVIGPGWKRHSYRFIVTDTDIVWYLDPSEAQRVEAEKIE